MSGLSLYAGIGAIALDALESDFLSSRFKIQDALLCLKRPCSEKCHNHQRSPCSIFFNTSDVTFHIQMWYVRPLEAAQSELYSDALPWRCTNESLCHTAYQSARPEVAKRFMDLGGQKVRKVVAGLWQVG